MSRTTRAGPNRPIPALKDRDCGLHIWIKWAGREKTGYTETLTPELLTTGLREHTARLGLWHDSTGETPRQTAAKLLERLDRSRVAAFPGRQDDAPA